MRAILHSHGREYLKKKSSGSQKSKKKIRHNYLIFAFFAPLVTGLFLSATNFNDAMQTRYEQSAESYERIKQDFWLANNFCTKFLSASEKERQSKNMYQQLDSLQNNITNHQIDFIVKFSGVGYFFSEEILQREHKFNDMLSKRSTLCTNIISYDELNQWQSYIFDPMKAKLYNLFPLLWHLFIKSTGIHTSFKQIESHFKPSPAPPE